MSTIRFWLRRDKADKDGLLPIELVYQIEGDRGYFRVKKRKLLPENWNPESQRAQYINPKAAKKNFPKIDGSLFLTEDAYNELNGDIQNLHNQIVDIQRRYDFQAKEYTVEKVLDELKGAEVMAPQIKPATDLLDFIDRYMENNAVSRVKGSLSVYRSLQTHLRGYEKMKKLKVTFVGIDHDFMEGFRNYLYSVTKKDKAGKETLLLNNITVAKILSTLKTFLNYARAKEIEVSTKYQAFKIKRDNPEEVVALTQDEYKILRDLNLKSRPAWDQVRDVFCFSCNTGLRFSDLEQLSWDHITGNVIDLTAVKTSHKVKVPINPDARAILNKYAGASSPLPVISNQKSNDHLAEICEFAGIDAPVVIVRKYGSKSVSQKYKKYELIRMHCGRKSFATISLEKGMRPEIVMKIGGWKSYASFRRYINITDESAMEAMTKAYDVPITKNKSKNKLKAV